MKNLVLALSVFIAALSFRFSMAQENLEDVVYLKNGNIYRGIIIEQVPGESIKVRTVGGNVFTVLIPDIQKITKEEKVQYGNGSAFVPSDNSSPQPIKIDTNTKNYSKSWDRKRGYLLQANFIVDFVQFGIRLVNGYKINRYAQIGVGIGADGVLLAPQSIFNDNVGEFSGGYFPLYLYFGGEILRKKATPYYTLEAGYAFAAERTNAPFFYASGEKLGGFMGSAGFGGRVNLRRYLNLTFLFNLNIKNVGYRTFFYDNNGQLTNSKVNRETLLFPGFRFGIGF